MPTVETNTGTVHTIVDPSTVGGIIRRIEAAQAEGKLARLKDSEGDTVGIPPGAVSGVY